MLLDKIVYGIQAEKTDGDRNIRERGVSHRCREVAQRMREVIVAESIPLDTDSNPPAGDGQEAPLTALWEYCGTQFQSSEFDDTSDDEDMLQPIRHQTEAEG